MTFTIWKLVIFKIQLVRNVRTMPRCQVQRDRGQSFFGFSAGGQDTKKCSKTLVLTLKCCIFRPAFGCCALQTLVEIVIFSIFAAKNPKKARNLQQIYAKNSFFKFAPERWSIVIKTSLQRKKLLNLSFVVNSFMKLAPVGVDRCRLIHSHLNLKPFMP